MSGQTIVDLLRRNAVTQGTAPAILAPGRAPLSHAGLLAQAEATATRLRELGIGRSGRVAVVLPNGPELAAAVISISAAAACTPLNPASTAGDLGSLLGRLRASAVVVDAAAVPAAVRGAEQAGVRVLHVRRDGDVVGAFSLDGPRAAPAGDPTWAGPDDVALVLPTSGTTARAKLVPLLGRNLRASASSIARTLGLGPTDRCLNILPLFHVHGLMGSVLATLEAGASVVCTDGVYGAKFFAWLEEHRPTWYTAVSSMHLTLLARARATREGGARGRLRLVRSSSAPLPSGALAEIEDLFGAPVIDAYGMTEAAHQVTSNPLPPGERKAGSVGPAAGAEVAILDPAGRRLPAGETGEVTIRGASVTSGYECDADANRAAFVQGWFRTGDLGRLDHEGYLFLTGRLKELINRGGEKIAPREVDEVLLAHPAVRQALAFGVPHPRLGEEVGAAVELNAPGAADEAALRHHAAERLPASKVPRTVWIVDEIPVGPTGKLQRLALVGALGVGRAALSPARGGDVEPRTELEGRIAAIWRTTLGMPHVGVTDEFALLGGDSLLAMQMLAAVSESERADLPFLRFFAEGTVQAIAAEIEAWREDGQERTGLVPIQPDGSRPPLYVVPGHDGALVGISGLTRLLGKAQPVWAFALAGHEDAASVGEVARRFVALLQRREPRGPYRLAGVCFGGLVAYEMARRLDGEGEQVELLALIDSLNPAWWRTQGVRGLAGALWRQWRTKAAYHRAVLRGLGVGAAARYIGGRLTKLAAYHGEALAARLEHAGLPVPRQVGGARRAYRWQMLTYVPATYRGRVLLVRVRGRRLDAPLLGWQGRALGAIEEVVIPLQSGGALSGDNRRRVAAALAARLG